MLITLKPPHEETFTVEIDISQTVEFFKEKIEKVKGDAFPAKTMELMYAGRYLLNNKRVCDYNLHEKKFVIVVCKKSSIVNEEPESSIVNEENESTVNIQGRRLALSIMRNSPDQNHPIGPEYEGLIRQIIDVGFSRDEVEAALHANSNNPNRAVEFLENSIISCSSSTDDSESEARDEESDHAFDDDLYLAHEFALSVLQCPGPMAPAEPDFVEMFSDEMDIECGVNDDIPPRYSNFVFDTDSPASPVPSSPSSPDPESPASPDPESPASPDPESSGSFDPESPASPGPESPESPDPDSPASLGPESPESPNPDSPASPDPDPLPLHFPALRYYSDEMDDCDNETREDNILESDSDNQSFDDMDETDMYRRSSEEENETSPMPYEYSAAWVLPDCHCCNHYHADDNDESLESFPDELED